MPYRPTFWSPRNPDPRKDPWPWLDSSQPGPDPNDPIGEKTSVPTDEELLKLERKVASAKLRYEAEVAIATQLFSKGDAGNPSDLHGENYSRWQVQHQRLRDAFKEYRTVLDAYIQATRSKLNR